MGELYGFLRQLWVLWLLLIFAGIVAWAFWPSRMRKQEMEDHAKIPFREDEPPEQPGPGPGSGPEPGDDDRRGS